MKVLDCHMSYGATNDGYPYRNCDTFEELCDSMDNAGIAGGLVRCNYSTTVGVVYGAQKTAADIASERGSQFRLWGVWPIIPPHTNEIPAPEDLPREMAKHKIAALYMDPVCARFDVTRVAIGPYLEMAQERNIPVFLNTCFHVSLEQTAQIMEWFPKLTAIVGDTDVWPNGRRLYPLAYSYENLYLDLAYVMDDCGTEEMTRRFGAEKLLFGTGFPVRYPGSMMATVRAAMISDADREKIFAGNLERLIAGEDLK